MKHTFEYKGYLGSAELSVEDNILHGRLLFIGDVISYAADTPKALGAAFRAAVDDYLATCEEVGDQPDVPFKGSFNVRLGPELHRASALEARRREVTLNEFMVQAARAACELSVTRVEHVHNHHLTVTVEGMGERRIATATRPTQWESLHGHHH